jgi:hypothetical protein
MWLCDLEKVKNIILLSENLRIIIS